MSERPASIEEALAYSDQFVRRRGNTRADSADLIDELQRQELAARDRHILTTAEIAYAVQLAEERNLTSKLHSQTLTAIRRVAPATLAITDDLERFGDTIVNGKRLYEQITEQHGVPVVVNGARAGGAYFHDLKHIIYESAHESLSTQLAALALTGRESHKTQDVIHERMHAVQFNLGSDTIPREFAEAHAYRITAPYDSMTPQHLITTVLKQPHSAPLYAKLDERKFQSAVYSIDRLNALGFNQPRIVLLISHPGIWSTNTGFWPRVKATIETAREEQGMTRADLERTVITRRYQGLIDTYQARNAAQQVLYNAFATEINNRRSHRPGFHVGSRRRITPA